MSPPEKKIDTNEQRFEKIENALDKITGVLSNLVEQLPQKKAAPPPSPVQHEQMKEQIKTLEVPPSWRAIVDEYLGTDFKTILQESAGGNFSMLVVFPPHIDRRIGTSRDPNKPDETMFSPIRLASTTDDIKRWCELTVKNIKSFSQYNNFIPKRV